MTNWTGGPQPQGNPNPAAAQAAAQAKAQQAAGGSSPKKSAKPESEVLAKITETITKIFSFIRRIIHAIFKIIESLINLLIFAFSYLSGILASPSFPCLVAIIAFGVVVFISSIQWWQVGAWIGRTFNLGFLYGIGAPIIGLAIGIGLNAYQMGPVLWKINRDLAKAYADIGVNTELETDGEEKPQQRHKLWSSYSHSFLKKGRAVSYAAEAAIGLVYLLISGLSFFPIIQTLISLTLPEQCLKLVSATVGSLGAASNKMHDNQAEATKDAAF
jgi:hypothetical protein